MTATLFLWVLFWTLFFVVCTADYVLASRRTDGMSVSSALRWTLLWVVIALGFSGAIYLLHPRGREIFLEYISGYLTEYSLSVDNLFVFLLIFSMMGVREAAQPKLIKLGIYLSLFLRILFILFGIALLHRFEWLIYVFGALLIFTAWKMVATGTEQQTRPDKNLFFRAANRFLRVRPEPPHSPPRLFIREGSRYAVTPLFLVFMVIGSTDVLFAIDSIPAIMGISQDPFVVLTSNVFAVLGLNSLFFAIRGVIGLFRYLKHGVSLILFLIGAKMLAGVYPPTALWFKDHRHVSLLLILTILLVSITASVIAERIHKKRPSAVRQTTDKS